MPTQMVGLPFVRATRQRLHTIAQHDLWYAVLIGFAVLTSLVSSVSAQHHLGLDRQPLILTEIKASKGEVVEQDARIAVERHPTVPLLLLYVPATRTARDCVLEVINPIKRAGEALAAIEVVNVLDVSELNILLDWIVRYAYEKDVIKTANKRARFFIDRKGTARSSWRIRKSECSYTLYHPTHQPLSGHGFPSKEFTERLKHNLTRQQSALNRR